MFSLAVTFYLLLCDVVTESENNVMLPILKLSLKHYKHLVLKVKKKPRL